MIWIPITKECPKPETFHGPFAESREVLIWYEQGVAIGKAFFYGHRNHALLNTPSCYVFTGLYPTDCYGEPNEDFYLRKGTHWMELDGPTET